MVLISVRGWVDPTTIVQQEGNEHATFRDVGQCLNQLRYRIFISSIIMNEL
jgi:hypothetical protein